MSTVDPIKVRFFASLREQLGSGGITLSDPPPAPLRVAELRQHLTAQGAAWQALNDPSLLIAVNQELADDTVTVHPGDEVAFFPPVTGG